jgi:mono/diheme cytochrome c family protein
MPYGLAAKPVALAPAVLAGLSFAAACGVTQLGATDANLARARSGSSRGAEVYATQCGRCHGERGEGTAAGPSVIGAGALPVYPSDQDRASSGAFADPQTLEEEARARPAGAPSRDPFRTAQDLFTFVAAKMPRGKDRAGSLPQADYWAVVNYVLLAHGSKVPAEGVNAGNAAAVPIEPD